MSIFAILMGTVGLTVLLLLLLCQVFRWLVEGGSIAPSDAVDRLGRLVDEPTRARLHQQMRRAR